MPSKNIKETIAGMSRKDKIDYLWTYYKWVPVVVVAVIYLICFVVNSNVETLYSGALVNVAVSDEGTTYLSDGWFQELGGKGKKQTVELISTQIASDSSLNPAEAAKIPLMVSAKELDYVMMDDVGFHYYKDKTVFSPLENVFTPEQLEQMKDHILYQEDETWGKYPIAIDISDSAFVLNCVEGTGCVYIAFPGNTTHTEIHDDFMEYLNSWKSQQ